MMKIYKRPFNLRPESTSKVIHIHVHHLLKPNKLVADLSIYWVLYGKKKRTPPQSPGVNSGPEASDSSVQNHLCWDALASTGGDMPRRFPGSHQKTVWHKVTFGLSSKKHHFPWHGMTLNISKLVKLDQAWFKSTAAFLGSSWGGTGRTPGLHHVVGPVARVWGETQ